MQPCARALTSTFSCGSRAGQRRCSGLHRPQTEAEVLEQSARTLRAHLAALLSALSRSVRACPAVVRATFRQLFRRVRERFPSAQHEVRPLPVGPGGGKKAVGKGAAVAPGGAVFGGGGASKRLAGSWGEGEAGTAPKPKPSGLFRAPASGSPAPALPHPLERAIHRRHQLPVPALRLSRHHGAQALPPAGAARGRPHQPHPAPAGQGAGPWTLARCPTGCPGGPCLDSGVPPTGSRNTCSTALYSLQSVFTGTDLVWMRKRVSEGQEVPQGRVACV